MSTGAPTGPARLLIQCRAPEVSVPGPWQRLRGWIGGTGRPHPPCAPGALRLHIDDLQGRCLFVLDDAGPLVDVPLPAGTYHVWAGVAAQQRCYTMTLEPGRPFTLRLPFVVPAVAPLAPLAHRAQGASHLAGKGAGKPARTSA